MTQQMYNLLRNQVNAIEGAKRFKASQISRKNSLSGSHVSSSQTETLQVFYTLLKMKLFMLLIWFDY